MNSGIYRVCVCHNVYCDYLPHSLLKDVGIRERETYTEESRNRDKETHRETVRERQKERERES